MWLIRPHVKCIIWARLGKMCEFLSYHTLPWSWWFLDWLRLCWSVKCLWLKALAWEGFCPSVWQMHFEYQYLSSPYSQEKSQVWSRWISCTEKQLFPGDSVWAGISDRQLSCASGFAVYIYFAYELLFAQSRHPSSLCKYCQPRSEGKKKRYEVNAKLQILLILSAQFPPAVKVMVGVECSALFPCTENKMPKTIIMHISGFRTCLLQGRRDQRTWLCKVRETRIQASWLAVALKKL